MSDFFGLFFCTLLLWVVFSFIVTAALAITGRSGTCPLCEGTAFIAFMLLSLLIAFW